MAKLRHIAMAVEDVATTARFYEEVFGMRRVHPAAQTGHSVLLTDGVVNLAIIDNTKSPVVKGHRGLHHVGFIVDDLGATQEKIESNGGVYSDDEERLSKRVQKRSEVPETGLKAELLRQEQRKFRDPNGLDFDIANDEHARWTWGGGAKPV